MCFGRRDNEKDVKGGRLKDGERETEVGREKEEGSIGQLVTFLSPQSHL